MKGPHWEWPDGGCLSVDAGHSAPRAIAERWGRHVEANHDEYVRIGLDLIAEEETRTLTAWQRLMGHTRAFFGKMSARQLPKQRLDESQSQYNLRAINGRVN